MRREEGAMSTVTTPSTLAAMPVLIPDVNVSASLIEDRRARGIDHHDEVWEGVYVMSPLANNEHQRLTTLLASILIDVIDRPGLGLSFAGVNLTDQPENWQKNFRCPDVVTFLKGNPAQNQGTHWLGGPDLAIEIVSPYDRTREKIEFYESVGARELLIIDRDPWQLELLRLAEGKLATVGASTLAAPQSLLSPSTRLSFQLAAGDDRPAIVVVHSDDRRTWNV
jgi:Uma2 family endonuclease